MKDIWDLHAVSPTKFSDWIVALRAGPARAFGQEGWKPTPDFTLPGFGRIHLEIKLNNVPYRLWGHEATKDVFEFLAVANKK